MSECVVRMEMPKSCEGCWMPSRRCKWRTLAWYLKDDSTVSYRNSRSPFCPIICQLPEGHGRLVDIDKPFLNVLKTCMGTAKYQATIAERLDMDSVINVEIIVPAEAERSET